MEASAVPLDGEKAVGEADSLECGFFWGVCHPASVESAASVDEAIDVWSIEELRRTSFVGQPVTLGHKDAEVAGTIIEDFTDAETGRKAILTYLPPNQRCSTVAQELFRSGGFEPELSIRHGFNVLCDEEKATASDSYDVKKTPIHVGICAFGRRPDCRIQFSASQKITAAEALRWEKHTALLRERASHGVSTRFSGSGRALSGVVSAGINTPQTVTPPLISSATAAPHSQDEPVLPPPPMSDAALPPTGEPPQQQPPAAAAVLPPVGGEQAAQPPIITPQTSLFGTTSEELAQTLVTLVGKRKADVERIAELERQLSAARAGMTAPAAAAAAPSAAPALSQARFEKMLEATITAAAREAGLDPTVVACSQEELRAVAAQLPGTMMLMNGIVSAAHSAKQDLERAQLQVRDFVERKKAKRSVEAASLKPQLEAEQRRRTLAESMAELDSLASRDPSLLNALGIAPRAAAPPSVKLEPQQQQAPPQQQQQPRFSAPNFGSLMRPRMPDAANSAQQRAATRVAQPYVGEDMLAMRDLVNAQLKKTSGLSQKELVQFVGDGDNTLI